MNDYPTETLRHRCYWCGYPRPAWDRRTHGHHFRCWMKWRRSFLPNAKRLDDDTCRLLGDTDEPAWRHH